MTRITVSVLIACCFLFGSALFPHPVSKAYAEDKAWKAEFDDICSKTADPMALSKAEVQGLIDRCEKLKPVIEKLDETTAKVYLKRLKQCKDLFVFVLETPAK